MYNMFIKFISKIFLLMVIFLKIKINIVNGAIWLP